MYVRCSNCLASTWADIVRPDGLVKSIACGDCGREYVLDPIEKLGGSIRDHYRRAVQYSNSEDLDVSSAYAVLLGIMSTSQAEILRHSRLPDPEPDDDVELALDPGPPQAGAGKSGSVPEIKKTTRFSMIPDFDLGFSKAIASGHLTIQQAMTRGDRDAFAARLMRRHKLQERLALAVTDNRVSLREALQRKEQQQRGQQRKKTNPSQPPGKSAPGRGSRVRLFAGAGLAGLILSALVWGLQDVPPPAATQPVLQVSALPVEVEGPDESTETLSRARDVPLRAATEVRTDYGGQVVEIIGPDPRSVLMAYCDAAPSPFGLTPHEITSTVPAFRNARLGVFRDHAADEPFRAIRMRKDSRTGRWIAGGGNTPIGVTEVPVLPEQAQRIPIRTR